MMTERWTRRELLAYSAFGAAATGLGPRVAASQEEPAAPKPSGSANEAIVLGFIGVGGMGSGLLNIFKGFPDVRVAAVCDVYEPHARRAQEAAGGKPDVYGDFRKVLDRKDIDAVVIATPDHWHAIPTIMACQAEKDVYCEKPLSHRVAEGRAMSNAAAKHKRVTQMGNLIHATENYHRVVEIVQSGVLGKITKTRAWMAASRDSFGHPADTSPPAGCDYDFWLGPAPERPFNINRFTFNWRWYWDYGGGILTDFCCHLIDLVHWAMEVDAPRTISATGGRYATDDNAETPDTLEVAYEYEKGDDKFLLAWSQTDASDHGFDGKPAGVMFQGTEATLVTNYNHHEIFPVKGKTIADPPKTLARSVGHHREWLDAIKTRASCSCNFEYGHRLTTVGELGNISLWTGEKLVWDRDAERITNHVEANQFLTKEYRKPWVLPTV
ncbi:Gfo/Idh/MocA family protein [Planctomyces sp. SH-PL62]|uniref:Gfo/Idh/MocA family protein n=1 Tax=Planctomyces sp. SH-PL62 TaxID=1636152 RepID=UPI00078D87A7|nr:Gfo/Idh/MocA family oxidoreductase [Planctomyces sp. SH-PL62]AMV39297.1 Inositol 2-dehydrogenase [Planctomyces sp. SH-PL62]